MAKSSFIPDGGAPKPALIFIPDISGFTRFVTNTEITHSRHIIEELLGILIDANDIGLQVNEVEGDAILFYRFGAPPPAAVLAEQIKKMFFRFHTHLKRYHSHAICRCGACKTASDLTLKFIVHHGDIAVNRVREYTKLFGQDVITAHRLLKNDIPDHEYALLTESVFKNEGQIFWAVPVAGEQEYDTGTVRFHYLSLKPLLAQTPEPVSVDYSLPGVKTEVSRLRKTVKAPLQLVFSVVADIGWRTKWMKNIWIEDEKLPGRITQDGFKFQCLRTGNRSVAHDFTFTNDTVIFTETSKNQGFCWVFTLRDLKNGETDVELTSFMKKNALKEWVFRQFFAKNFNLKYAEALDTLDEYCSDLVRRNKPHRMEYVLEE